MPPTAQLTNQGAFGQASSGARSAITRSAATRLADLSNCSRTGCTAHGARRQSDPAEFVSFRRAPTSKSTWARRLGSPPRASACRLRRSGNLSQQDPRSRLGISSASSMKRVRRSRSAPGHRETAASRERRLLPQAFGVVRCGWRHCESADSSARRRVSVGSCSGASSWVTRCVRAWLFAR